jgi:hypothetical protein
MALTSRLVKGDCGSADIGVVRIDSESVSTDALKQNMVRFERKESAKRSEGEEERRVLDCSCSRFGVSTVSRDGRKLKVQY